ncbi:IclR family transcriptional regulator [Saccharothrix coeruleofusca]|nr:IclR family transcriptional regulator [Saccharothrix coeruleofusca]MBP2337330.1 DNA-binding IclR family transcriptional regulator [Saccharothrix coeruleofusca]
MGTEDQAGDAAGKNRQSSGIRSMNSVLSTLRVFEEVAARQPIGVSELSRATGIPKSSVQRCLVTLQQAGWLRVVDPEHARWGMTMKALMLGLRGAGEKDLREAAAPVIKRLAAETGETVLLGLRDQAEYVIIAQEESSQVVRVFMDIGTRVPLVASTGGVSIMARLAAEEVADLLRSDLTSFADTPLLPPDQMLQEIARTTERGYALDMSSWFRPHVASIGAAITNATGRPIAAVTLAIPVMRYDREREKSFARLVVAAAQEISDLISAT